VTPVVGEAQGWFAGRVYDPSVNLPEGKVITLTFAGYHEQKSKHALGDYRMVGRVLLYTNTQTLPPSLGNDD
jgi:hypothetical protein